MIVFSWSRWSRATWWQGNLQYWICRNCQGLCTCDVNWTITVNFVSYFVEQQECSTYHKGSSSCSDINAAFCVRENPLLPVCIKLVRDWGRSTDTSELVMPVAWSIYNFLVLSFFFRCMSSTGIMLLNKHDQFKKKSYFTYLYCHLRTLLGFPLKILIGWAANLVKN